MAKYLIISKERDYISSSRNTKDHAYKTKGKGIQVYDKNGELINSATKDENGNVTLHGRKFYDGEPREWAAEFIKDNEVGTSVPDACKIYYETQV